MRKQRKAFSKQEKQQQIVGVFLDQYRNGFVRLTCADVAHYLDNRPSTKLMELLKSLVNQRVLKSEEIQMANIAGFTRYFSFTDEYRQYAAASLAKQKRGHELRINTRKGQFVEVLK